MEPFHPEAPEASQAEIEERRRRDKERLLRRLRKWRNRRAEESQVEARPSQQQPAAPELDTPPTHAEHKGKLMGRVLNYFIPRPAATESVPPSKAETADTTTPAEAAPRFRRIRHVTNRVLARVVETHEEVRAVATMEAPTPQVQEETASLQAVEWELRRVSDQFDAALQTEGSLAENRQGPPLVEDASGYAEQLTMPPSEAADVPLQHDFASDSEDRFPDAVTSAPSPPAEYYMPPQVERQQREIARAPRIASSALRVTAIPREGLSMVTPEAPLRRETGQLRRNQQTLDTMQREHVDMRDAMQRHQRVQETVNLARSQTEIVSHVTQAIQAERSAPSSTLEQSAPLPVTQASERQVPLTVAPQEALPQQPIEAESWRQTLEESRTAPLPLAEKAPASPATKEAPTERELSDRVERDPGRNWQAQAQQQSGGTTSSTTPSLPMPIAMDDSHHNARHDDRQRAKSVWQQQNTSWLLVTVLVVIIAGMVMLSLSF